MFRYTRSLALVVLVMLLVHALPAPAQEDKAFTLFAESGRFSVDVPIDWGGGTVPNYSYLELKFIGDNLLVADSHDTAQEWFDTGETDGSLLLIRTYPVASYAAQRPEVLLEMHLTVYHEELYEGNKVEFTEIKGYPTAKLQRGATVLAFAVLVDYLIYDMVLIGEDTAALEWVANSLTLYPDPTTSQIPRYPLMIDEILQVDTQLGWLVMDWGYGSLRPFSGSLLNDAPATTTTQAHYYVMMPDQQQATLDALYQGLTIPSPLDLPGHYIEVVDYPYDNLFGSASAQITDAERRAALTQFVEERQGVVGVIESRDNLGVPALYAQLESVYGEANHGEILLVDTNQKLYMVMIAAPQATYDSVLAQTLLDGIQVQDPFATTLPDEPVVGLQVGQQAPDFTLTLLNGEEVSLSAYRDKIVLVNFWAVWCRPCREEMPIFNAVAQAREDVVILSVNFMDKPDDVQKFVDELGLVFPIALDERGVVNQLYSIHAYPTSFIIDPNGIVHSSPIGDAPTVETVNGWLDAVNVTPES